MIEVEGYSVEFYVPFGTKAAVAKILFVSTAAAPAKRKHRRIFLDARPTIFPIREEGWWCWIADTIDLLHNKYVLNYNVSVSAEQGRQTDRSMRSKGAEGTYRLIHRNLCTRSCRRNKAENCQRLNNQLFSNATNIFATATSDLVSF